MNFDLGAEAASLKKEVGDFLREHLTDELRHTAEATGTAHDRAFVQALAERGWVRPAWAGEQRHWLEHMVIGRELRRAKAPTVGLNITLLVAGTLRRWARPDVVDEIVPAALRGDVQICLGYSEADSGSDIAAARTRAVRDGDAWVIDGEKMFTTMAHASDYVFLLTRTNPDVPKHKGLTMFLVPMTTPGIEVTEVHTLSGERTNVTSYQGVRVSDRWRIGEVDQGWAVLTTALQREHSGNYSDEIERVLDATVEFAASGEGPRLIDRPSVRRRLARVALDVEVASLLGLQAGWLDSVGRVPEAEGPMSKLFSAEAFGRATRVLMDICGPDALSEAGDDSAPEIVEVGYRHSQVTRIYGGTTEIQRNLIAERGLGLPRARPAR